MADKDPTMTVDDPASEGDGADSQPSGFTFDEQTLGQSESVFDSGVDLTPPVVPPAAPPAGGYAQPGPWVDPNYLGQGYLNPPYLTEGAADQAFGDDGYVEQPERELTAFDRRRRVRLEARRVRRVVRHIEPWSVLKISLIFFACMWLIFLLAGVLLWSFAERTDTLANIEELIEKLFALKEENDFWSGGTIFRFYALTTLVFSIAGVTFNVLLAVLYNLISDLTGGLRLTVIEEETARFTPPQRRQRR